MFKKKSNSYILIFFKLTEIVAQLQPQRPPQLLPQLIQDQDQDQEAVSLQVRRLKWHKKSSWIFYVNTNVFYFTIIATTSCPGGGLSISGGTSLVTDGGSFTIDCGTCNVYATASTYTGTNGVCTADTFSLLTGLYCPFGNVKKCGGLALSLGIVPNLCGPGGTFSSTWYCA